MAEMRGMHVSCDGDALVLRGADLRIEECIFSKVASVESSAVPNEVRLFPNPTGSLPARTILHEPFAGSIHGPLFAAAQKLALEAEAALDRPEPPGRELQEAVEQFREVTNG